MADQETGKVGDDRIREALEESYRRLGIGGEADQGTAVRSERRGVGRPSKESLGLGPLHSIRHPARRTLPPAVTRGFADEVGARVMRWDWIENRRGDRLEDQARQGGALLAFHMAGCLYARLTEKGRG